MLKDWLLLAAMHFSPPERLPQFEGHEETYEQTVERYGGFVDDIDAAVTDRPNPRSSAALALAWAIGEGGMSHDAMVGPCYRSGAYARRCDSGRAAGPFQMWAFTDRVSGERFEVPDIFARRADVTRIAVRQLAAAWTTCRHLAPEDRLSGFGLGHCEAGNEQVRKRYRLWQTIRAWNPDE